MRQAKKIEINITPFLNPGYMMTVKVNKNPEGNCQNERKTIYNDKPHKRKQPEFYNCFCTSMHACKPTFIPTYTNTNTRVLKGTHSPIQ